MKKSGSVLQPLPDRHIQRIIWYNAFALIVHLFANVTPMLYLAIAKPATFTLPVTTTLAGSFADWNSARATRVLFHVQPFWYTVIFSGLSTINHALTLQALLSSNPWLPFRRYFAQRCNPVRWIEYSVSASFMNVGIAQMSGIYDIFALIFIYVCTAMTMLLGLMAERSKHHAKRLFMFGWLPFLVTWGVILASFFYAVSNATRTVPDWIWTVALGMFILESLFGWWFWEQITHPEQPWYQIEAGYTAVLSPGAKTVLAWMIFQGGRRTD